jgi:hypothetical protein
VARQEGPAQAFWVDGYGGRGWRLGVLAAVAAALVGLVGVRLGRSGAPAAAAVSGASLARQDGRPVPATLLATLAAAAQQSLRHPTSAQLLTSPVAVPGRLWRHGKQVVVLYVGADYCPFCAAQRWALVLALLRFGRFTSLHLMTSSAQDLAPSTATFTFYRSGYESPYLTLQEVELTTNRPNASGTYPTLQTPTPLQNHLVNTYDAPPYVPANSAGSIPFVDVANRYVWVGSSYDPRKLQGMDWSHIAAAVRQAAQGQRGAPYVGRAVVQTANLLTAAVCQADGGRPGAVCQAPAVVQAEASLP